ncbi:MFS transporter [Spirosoma spitsbergense]|uniref:MFS transporter n=1 Tax=Spirosoma spitsbergense TaxID=431554 RepID=UPI00037E2544|nr:MFS transporter [Spirosoma spitsbergense]
MSIQLGLRQNWGQFSLLVLITAFVGGMIGLERTILPRLAETVFGLEAHSAILTFIVVFGIAKALTNYYAGSLANRMGRKNLLVVGWLFGLPVPFMLMWADSWNWVIMANVLLGINQGLAWSSTVVMKIDLVGEKNRGLAMGLNESAGYLAVAFSAFATGWIASRYGLQPYPFYLGIAFSVIGLGASWLWVNDTRRHADLEGSSSKQHKRQHIFWETTWRDRNLGSITQAGLVNNLNDGMVWGLFPVLLATKGFTLEQIGTIVAVYPAFWGVGQLGTGKLADYVCPKTMLVWGMLLQGLALIAMLWVASYASFLGLSALLGIGTALVYPTFLTAIARFTHPAQRAETIGIFRLWRDLGYAIGALLTGFIADWLGLNASVLVIGLLTILSSAIIQYRMRCREKALPGIKKQAFPHLQ